MNILTRNFIGGLLIAKNVVGILRVHALNIIGVERQLAQADRLVQFAAEHPIHSDMLGAQTGFRMKTIIGISVMPAQKRPMLGNTFGIAG